jgi:hypothetical protein
MALEISTEAQRLIDTHNFNVTMTGKNYVVRDPTMKKKRFESPVLLDALNDAVNTKLNTVSTFVGMENTYTVGPLGTPVPTGSIQKPAKKVVDPVTTIAQVTAKGKKTQAAIQQKQAAVAAVTPRGKTAAQAVAESPKNDPGEDDEFEAEDIDDTGGKVKKVKTPTVKKAPLDWTTGKVGMLILRHADKSDAEIFAMCVEQGIDTKLLTVKGLRRYFRLCIQCQIALAAETPTN